MKGWMNGYISIDEGMDGGMVDEKIDEIYYIIDSFIQYFKIIIINSIHQSLHISIT